MPRLNLDDPNVHEHELTVAQIRVESEAALDALGEEIYGWLDEAQGDVFSGKYSKVYVVIEVTK